MPFPISRRMEGEVDRSEEEAIAFLRRGLRHMDAQVQRSGSKEIRFRVSFFNTSTPLSMIDSGLVTVIPLGPNRSRVVMTLSFRRSAIILGLGVLIWLGGGTVVMSGEPWWTIVDKLPFLAIGFLWLLGPWFVIAPFRIRRHLGLEESNHFGVSGKGPD